MTAPVRLRLSRAKGFDLQKYSRSVNGREAVVVSRPGPWGNPFVVHPHHKPGRRWGIDEYFSVPTVEDAVECFREMLAMKGARAEAVRSDLPKLLGKNLACWCALDAPCHADVLLELANRPTCERVG